MDHLTKTPDLPPGLGTILTEGPHKEVPHTSTRVYGTPEGVLFVATCSACGGRDETLLPFNGGPPSKEEVSRVLEWQGAGWVQGHADCTGTPVEHLLPERAEKVVKNMVDGFRDRLAAGRPTVGMLVVLTTGADAIAIDFLEAAVANPHVPMPALISIVLEGLRHMIRKGGGDPIAAVAITESVDEVGNEAGVVVVTTPTSGRFAIAPITRKDGDPDGPGELGELEWRPLGEAMPLVDGALALPFIEPGNLN